jgi:hypothetical protein
MYQRLLRNAVGWCLRLDGRDPASGAPANASMARE